MKAVSSAFQKTVGAGDFDSFKPQVLGEGAHTCSENAGKMYVPTCAPADDYRWRVDVNESSRLHSLIEVQNIVTSKAKAPVG